MTGWPMPGRTLGWEMGVDIPFLSVNVCGTKLGGKPNGAAIGELGWVRWPRERVDCSIGCFWTGCVWGRAIGRWLGLR